MDRKAITSAALQDTETVRFVSIFQAGEGTGEINEIGLFGAAESQVVVHNCDSATSWTTNGAITLDTTNHREGTGCLQCITNGTGAQLIAFNQATTINANCQAYNTDSTYLQGWYYTNNATAIDGADLVVRAYTGASDYYYWNVTTSGASPTIEADWNWLNLEFLDASTSGSPNIEASNISRISVLSTKDNGVSVLERLDHLRVFHENGDLWARVETPTEITKTYGTVVGVYWFLSMREGGANVTYTAFDQETLTITNAAATGFTTSKIQPTGGADPARQARVTVRSGGGINWTQNGTSPTDSTGNGPVAAGDTYVFYVEGTTNLANWKAILNSGGTNATVFVEYLR